VIKAEREAPTTRSGDFNIVRLSKSGSRISYYKFIVPLILGQLHEAIWFGCDRTWASRAKEAADAAADP
jgi:hypothetical protein